LAVAYHDVCCQWWQVCGVTEESRLAAEGGDACGFAISISRYQAPA